MLRGEIYTIVNAYAESLIEQNTHYCMGVILSENRKDSRRPLVTVVLISDNLRPLVGPIHIPVSAAEYRRAMCDHIITLPRHCICNLVGECTEIELEKINKGILHALMLPMNQHKVKIRRVSGNASQAI